MRKRLALIGVLAAVAVVVVVVWLARHRDGGGEPASNAPAGTTAHARGPRVPPAPAAVSGHVARKAGGPIAGATVALEQVELGAGMSHKEAPPLLVTSDAGGAWTIAKVPPGTYLASAGASGFLPAVHDKIVIAAGESRTGIDFALEPGGTLVHGTVTDVGGGPIAGARVIAVEESIRIMSGEIAPVPALTGADGKYELTLADGAYQLAAGHDDYTSAHHTVHVQGKPLVVDFSLVPGGHIRGQVIARDTGKPVPGAMVSAHAGHHRDTGGGSEASSDSDGKFELHSLRSGAIAISAAASGYASSSPTTVELGIGEQVDGVRVLVDHALSISGRVVDKASQKPIAGAHVGAFSMGNQAMAQAPDPTGEDGAFEIIGVKPGSYMLFVMADDKMPDLGKPVEVTDKDVTGVVVELARGATLSGRVIPASRASIGLALVGEVGLGNLMDMFKTAFVHADADADGTFLLHHVPAGKFQILATTAEGPAGKLAVTVADADQANLVVTLETRASISGRVIDTNGAPVEGVKVRARPHEREQMMTVSIDGEMRGGATSASDGSFKLVGLEAGKYMVEAEDLEDLIERMTKKDAKHDVIELAAGSERTGVTVTVEAKDGVIRGNVVGSDGKSVADAWVRASRQPNSGMPAKMAEYVDFAATPPVLTGPDGKFAIERLRKGSYHVVVEGPRGASRGEQADVKTGSSITITLASLGTLSGHVLQRAAPVASYDLLCHGPVGRVDRHVDAADGAYSIEHLAPGHYECVASADAGTASGEVDVPSSAATLELSLVPWASITGTLVSVLSGQPVPGVAAIAFDAAESGRSIAGLLSGNVPTSDASGRFTIDHVANGSGSVMIMAKSGMSQPLASKPYTASQGQRVDLGTIKIVPPRTSDPGTLGMATDPEDSDLAVTLVQPGGPAAQAGVVVGDKITAIEGQAVSELTPKIAQQVLSSGTIGAGQKISLTLARGSTVSVTAAKF